MKWLTFCLYKRLVLKKVSWPGNKLLHGIWFNMKRSEIVDCRDSESFGF